MASPRKKHLRSVSEPTQKLTDVEDLLSGKVSSRIKRGKRNRVNDKPTEELPKSLAEMADIMAAGRRVEKETEFKIRYAEQKIRHHCLQRFSENFAATGHRPASVTYTGAHSRFTYIPTRRVSLNEEKVEALRSLEIPIDDYTELRGMRINYEVIRENHLEDKLRQALQNLGVSKQVLQEAFEPQVELKDTFLDHLSSIVFQSFKKSPSKKESSDRLYEVVQVLDPTSQIRNPDTPGMTVEKCFKLITEAEIAVDDLEEELKEVG